MLDLMIDGLTVREIAERMQIPVRRAIYYNDSLRAKFLVKSRYELVRISRARYEARNDV